MKKILGKKDEKTGNVSQFGGYIRKGNQDCGSMATKYKGSQKKKKWKINLRNLLMAVLIIILGYYDYTVTPIRKDHQ